MSIILSAFASGLLFGLGLVVSQMVNPAKVLGFLDIFGDSEFELRLGDGGRGRSVGFGLCDRQASRCSGAGSPA